MQDEQIQIGNIAGTQSAEKETCEIATLNTKPKALAEATMWNDVGLMQQAWKMANTLAQTTMIPQAYRGKVGDCLIAIDMGNRLGLPPIAVMQNSQVVQGNFSWKGTACKAMIDSCGIYTNTEYVEVGEQSKDTWGYYLQAIEKKTGRIVKGVVVTIDMAKKEGWYSKNGSKWQTMPELMLKYRAAAFFMRTECANIAMGFLTVEENEDIYGAEDRQQNKASKITKLIDIDSEDNDND